MTGEFADRHPEGVKRIAAAGYALGNHSSSHPYFKNLTVAGRQREVRAADRTLRAAGAVRAMTPFFPLPYSETSSAYISEVNAREFADIEFTADTNGWMGIEGGMSVDRAVRRALDVLRPAGAEVDDVVAAGGERIEDPWQGLGVDHLGAAFGRAEVHLQGRPCEPLCPVMAAISPGATWRWASRTAGWLP
ncbi:polysaccharide deacetylase family protein [Streptomyces sp. NPDC040750]|uniref:polysaccharide deacetylase family protein n=1 Tax=Streptomyces sp. NPDC040750 TaxID=3154491 RepID=UPI0033F560A8